MTIQRYLMMALRDSGMDEGEFSDAVVGRGNYYRMRAYLEGRAEPEVHTLRRAEKVSGASLDLIDPRIRRADALAGPLVDLQAERQWPDTALARAIGVSAATLDTLREKRRLHRHATVAQAAAICDVAEGRKPVLTKTEARRATQAGPADDSARESGALPPEAGGDPTWHRAREAFCRTVGPEWRAFRLRNTGPCTFEAMGDLLKYRIEVRGKAVRIIAAFRQSGAVLCERVV